MKYNFNLTKLHTGCFKLIAQIETRSCTGIADLHAADAEIGNIENLYFFNYKRFSKISYKIYPLK